MKMKLINKHLLLILLGFGLIGCAGQTLISSSPDGVDISEGWIEWKKLYPYDGVPTYNLEKASVEGSSKVFYKILKEKRAIQFKSNGLVIHSTYLQDKNNCNFANLTKMDKELPLLCKEVFGGGIKTMPILKNAKLHTPDCKLFGRKPSKIRVLAKETFATEKLEKLINKN